MEHFTQLFSDYECHEYNVITAPCPDVSNVQIHYAQTSYVDDVTLPVSDCGALYGNGPDEQQAVLFSSDTSSSSRSASEPEPDCAHYTDVVTWLNEQACGGNVKRKRRVSKPQRLAANRRERRRMDFMNEAFAALECHIPKFPHEKKLSRIQTLKSAISYIALMTEMLSAKRAQTDYSFN